MSNSENDIRLEQRSRDAASGYTPPGKASWEKMEAALDQVMPVQEKKRRRFLFWWLLPLFFLGAIAIYLAMPNGESGFYKITQQVSTEDHKTTEKNSIPNNLEKTANDQTSSLNEKESAIISKDVSVSNLPVESGTITPKSFNQNKTSSIQKNKLSDIAQSTAPKNNQNLEGTMVDQKSNEPVLIKKQADSETKPGTSTNAEKTVTYKESYNIKATADSGSINSVTGILEQKIDSSIRPAVANNDSLNKDKHIPKTTDSRFSFALAAGIDASTVKFKHSSKTGINIGIMTGYHFNDTWSVHTGVFFTRKNYSIAGEDFHAPKGSWVANYKLTMVEGYCNMWEVPLLLRYKFNGSAKRGFFLSTGISSYFMTRENYNYSYYWNGQPYTRNSNYLTGKTHLLSILKLSAGWRKSVGPATSLLIEPYAALPLSGLGYGSIRLSSFGLNFSLQLRQPYEKK